MKGSGLLTVAIIAAVLVLIIGAGEAGARTPDPVRYTGRTDEGKLRLGTRDGKVVGIVFHGTSACRDEDGEIMEPYFGTGVTSGFNEARLKPSGRFRSHQRYRHRNPVTGEIEPFVRTLEGSIGGPGARATVSIHYSLPLHRFRGRTLRCRTGKVSFELKRVTGA